MEDDLRHYILFAGGRLGFQGKMIKGKRGGVFIEYHQNLTSLGSFLYQTREGMQTPIQSPLPPHMHLHIRAG